jgi:hypothetical protein
MVNPTGSKTKQGGVWDLFGESTTGRLVPSDVRVGC